MKILNFHLCFAQEGGIIETKKLQQITPSMSSDWGSEGWGSNPSTWATSDPGLPKNSQREITVSQNVCLTNTRTVLTELFSRRFLDHLWDFLLN